MQEGMPMDPISVCGQLPLEDRLFLLYLATFAVVAVVRSVKIVRYLWSSARHSAKKLSSETEGTTTQLSAAWEVCSRKVQSTKRLVILTLMLAALLTVYRLKAVFVHITFEKRYGVVDSGSIAESLTLLLFAIAVSAAVYAACLLYEGALARRKARLGS
jgi:hypothetical protein